MHFQGKTAWVTGASSGIGKAVAGELVAQGAAVILSGRDVDRLNRVATEIGGKALILPFEATEFDALPGIVKQAEAWSGGVDLLINNAGVSQRSLALDTAFSVYKRLIDIDFLAPLCLTQLVLPEMVKRRSGQIAIVSSVAGKIGGPLRSGYCAAKHACIGYFDALRAEVELAYGIDVSVIVPGYVRTGVAINALTGNGNRYNREDSNIESGMSANEAAAIILEGLAAKKREIVVADDQMKMAMQMRSRDPEALFDLFAKEGERLANLREQAGLSFSAEYGKIDIKT